jgi:putative redox protein
MPTEKLTFPGALSAQLAARLERPTGEPIAYALFAHCFTCSKDLRAVREISRALCDEGLAVLRFDFTEGEFADSDFSSNVDDLVAAANYLRREYRAPGLLIGHSLGGAAVLLAAAKIPEAKAVATIGAPSDTKHLRASLIQSAPELASTDEAEIELEGRKFTIKRRFLEDLGSRGAGRGATAGWAASAFVGAPFTGRRDGRDRARPENLRRGPVPKELCITGRRRSLAQRAS